MPLMGRGGLALETGISSWARAVWAADAEFSPDAGALIHGGAEITLFETVALRGGWRGTGVSAAGPTWGLGLHVPRGWFGLPLAMRLDYAGGMSGELGATHRLQLMARFSPPLADLKPRGFKVAREGSQRALSWTGGHGPFEVAISSASDRAVVWHPDEPVREQKVLLPSLVPGTYLIAVGSASRGSTGWRREKPEEVRLTIAAPKGAPKEPEPRPVAVPVVHLLVAPHDIKLETVDGTTCITWQGGGPAWKVLRRVEGSSELDLFTDEPLTEPRFPLPKMPPGSYFFVVRSVDPGEPLRQPADSAEFGVSIKMRMR